MNSSDFGHSLNNYFSGVISAYFIILVLCSIVFNGLLIYVIWKNTLLYSTTNAFIVNLAVGNLLVAVTVLPFEIEYLLRGHYGHGKFICGLKETMFFLSLPSSIVNLFLLTIERFVKISMPYKYDEVFTRGRVVVMIFVVWSYTLLIALFPFMLNHDAAVVDRGKCYTVFPLEYGIYQIVGNFAVPIICIVAINLMMFWIAQKHYKHIEKQKVHLNNSSNEKPKRYLNFTANFKAAKTIMMLVGVFLFCWLTYIILLITNIMCDVCHPRELTWMGNAINYSSIALNPLLYGLRNSDVRKALLREYRRWSWLRNDGVSKRVGKSNGNSMSATTVTYHAPIEDKGI